MRDDNWFQLDHNRLRNNLTRQLMKDMAMRTAQKPSLAVARDPTYELCRKCGSMLIEDSRGGLKCINAHEYNNLNFSRQSDLTDVNR